MAVTKGEMTSLPFLQTVEEPEDSRINFRDSLKFFQEQLVINGASFPSPSPGFRSGNNTLRKNGHRSYKAQTSDSNGESVKESNTSENDMQTIRSCKIAIPTVDTILESVRVLRAIQKSQQERGSNWNLDVTSKSDIEFNCTDDWIEVGEVKPNGYPNKISENSDQTPPDNSVEKQTIADTNQNGYSDKESINENHDEIHSANCASMQTNTDINQNGFCEESNTERNDEIYSKHGESKPTNTDINQNDYSSNESNNERNCDTPPINSVQEHIAARENQNENSIIESNDENDERASTDFGDKQTIIDINQSGHFEKESNNEDNETPSTNSEDKQTVTDINQNGYCDKKSNYQESDETCSNSEAKQTITNINQNGYFDKQCNNGNDIESFSIDSVCKQDIDTAVTVQVDDKKENLTQSHIDMQFKWPGIQEIDNNDIQDINTTTAIEVDNKKENLTQSHNDTQFKWPVSNPVNEICSFWPSNTLHNEKPWNGETNNDETFQAVEENKITFSEILNEFTKTDSLQLNENSILKSINAVQHSNVYQSLHEDITKNTKTNDSSDSLRAVCRDFFNHLNEAPIPIEKSKEIFSRASDTTSEILKIETYADIDVDKHDHLLLSESLWKESCLPSDSTSTKIEHNDSDSGIGTQRSASSLSPNNPNQIRKDSWSDTCSSHYASAECSPYHSLNSVFESSLGLNSTGETREVENSEVLKVLTESKWQDAEKKPQEKLSEDHALKLQETNESTEIHTTVPQENKKESLEVDNVSTPQQLDCDKEKHNVSEKYLADSPTEIGEFESHSGNSELDTEISYCHFITSYTIEKPCETVQEALEAQQASTNCDSTLNQPKTLNDQETKESAEDQLDSETCDNSVKEPKILNGQETNTVEPITEAVQATSEQSFDLGKAESLISLDSLKDSAIEDDSCDLPRIQKFNAASCDLISIVQSLYIIKENPVYQVLPTEDDLEENFKETLFVLSKGAFCEHPEDNYLVTIENSTLNITKDSQVLLSLNVKYGEVSVESNILKIDNRMGRCVYVRCEFANILPFQARIKLHCLKHWQADCLQLVHYPLKCHQNVVIIDIGSCSTRAGILMDQPTLPSLFFPTICATDKRTGTCVYGMEALQSEVRQHSNLSFPVRPTLKITKHTIDIDLMEGLFKKIFRDLNVDPTQYTVQVSLPRSLSINAQTALVKLLLEGLNVKAVSLTNQALLTLYAHDVSTAVVVDIGDRTDVLPVVDGFIVENGVTKLPHGGQRLIHHMKHGLAEKRISLSTDIDSFIVQYIIENLAYVADDYEKEVLISSQYQEVVTKTVILQPATAKSSHCKSITLEEARFKIPEGLFNPELWGLDSPGIHHLVQKAIQATSVDERKRIAENIYVSGGVTMLPGFVERLQKEVTKLSKAKIVPKVHASNYRYHCTYIGACKFAKMKVFPQVCITLQEYTENSASALKKCALYF